MVVTATQRDASDPGSATRSRSGAPSAVGTRSISCWNDRRVARCATAGADRTARSPVAQVPRAATASKQAAQVEVRRSAGGSLISSSARADASAHTGHRRS